MSETNNASTSDDSSGAGNNGSSYFDLHVEGLGYLYRPRLVSPERSQPFQAVDISALHGEEGKADYTRFDCRVSGSEAKDIMAILEPEIKEGKNVLVGFKLGDMYIQQFTYTGGEKDGQPGAVIKARLLKIKWAKVDGVSVDLSQVVEEIEDKVAASGN